MLRGIIVSYPKRFVLGMALFIGQAFLYNAILFGYATLLSKFFGLRGHWRSLSSTRSAPASAGSSVRSCSAG